MKCTVCKQRKGKRPCPAKNAGICPQCCGEKRILEIDCPEACQYLRLGREREVYQEMARHLRISDPAESRKRQRAFFQFSNFLTHVQSLFAEERRSSRHLTDKDVAEALDLVLDTLRTEEKGIHYERVSSDLRVDALRKQLRDIVEFHRRPPEEELGNSILVSEPEEEPPALRDAIECLEVLRDVVASHIDAGDEAKSYVNFLVRQIPRRQKIEATDTPLIIPGR